MRIPKTPKSEHAFGIEVEGGVDVDGGLPFISRIVPDSSASKSDLQLCDLVLTINGQVSVCPLWRCVYRLNSAVLGSFLVSYCLPFIFCFVTWILHHFWFCNSD
jgi:hypothetical protein